MACQGVFACLSVCLSGFVRADACVSPCTYRAQDLTKSMSCAERFWLNILCPEHTVCQYVASSLLFMIITESAAKVALLLSLDFQTNKLTHATTQSRTHQIDEVYYCAIPRKVRYHRTGHVLSARYSCGQ